ncbi:hypothetical protein ACEQ8H_008156 [Pleosporales sp. CAS-2024a]
MAHDSYKDYLAARVLAENKPVTYRLLSRAVKVDVNSAKLMLFDFHQQQNSKKAHSVHATYLVTGRLRALEPANDATDKDVKEGDLPTSSFVSSMPEPEEEEEDDGEDDDDEDDNEPVAETTILLVREEDLQHTRAGFDEVTSMHVYSLEPGPIELPDVLAACNHELITEHLHEDPLSRWKAYRSIHNPHIKRRTARSAHLQAASTTSRPTTKPFAKTGIIAPVNRKDGAPNDIVSNQSTPRSSAGTPSLKRFESKSSTKSQTAGDLFKSFAKAKPLVKDVAKSKESTPAEDELMQGMSEDEGDIDDASEVAIDDIKSEAARKAREERQEKLRKMMEDDDEDMPDAPVEANSQCTEEPIGNAQTRQSTLGEGTVTIENGRRRGRRRVMKKKKVKDEDGYLVTKEEAVWESFSEDEPEAKKLKSAPNKTCGSTKGKPAGKKGGQGSIANFFKKA